MKKITLFLVIMSAFALSPVFSHSCSAACSMESTDEAKITEAVVGEPAPHFTLPSIDGNEVLLSDYKGNYVVLEWTNYDCPFVVKHYATGNMQRLQNHYIDKGVKWVVINSSAPGLQGHFAPEKWAELAEERESSPTHILLDEDGKVGRMYLAQTTPQMYVIDPEGHLRYMGAIDDDSSRNHESVETASNYVAAALDALLAGEEVETPQTRPYGCSVKYAE